jgi:hypothetical protein
MHESDRNRWLKIQRALLLAASDMDQAAAAARALEPGIEDYNLARALETAIAVCYARVFMQSSLYRLDRAKYEPADPRLARLHRMLCDLRATVYAHTDKSGGRDASIIAESPIALPGVIDFLRSESWTPLPRSDIEVARELFAVQRRRFHDEAGKIYLLLQGPPEGERE